MLVAFPHYTFVYDSKVWWCRARKEQIEGVTCDDEYIRVVEKNRKIEFMTKSWDEYYQR